MTGGGELAAVFQARRVTKKVEEETAASSGELAAVFQARKKIGDDNDDGNNTISMTSPRSSSSSVGGGALATTPVSPPSVALPSTPKSNGGGSANNNKYQLPSLSSPMSPDISASATRNKALTAKFESRDLEAGIPTPGFLQDVRKNLKKPGEKKVAPPPPSVTSVSSTAPAESKSKMKTFQEQRDEGEGMPSSSSSSSKASSGREQSHQDLMAARRSRMVATRSAAAAAAAPADSGLVVNSSSISSGDNQNVSKSAPTTPSRKDKLRARVRANHLKSLTPVQSKLDPDELSVGKVYISSPTNDEFELSFFETNHPSPIPELNDGDGHGNQKQKLLKQTQQHFVLGSESIDSVYKDLHTTSTGSTIKTANNSSANNSSAVSGGVSDRTAFREHNASTPKISGSQHSQYDDEEEVVYGPTNRARPGGLHHRETSMGSVDEYNLSQPFAVTRSPSQGSQLSAITTPSCFPQDNISFPAFGNNGHARSMSNNWTHEKPILEINESFGHSASGSTGKHSGNDEMREQMMEFKKKLEEKDAIISQLMKRISDLEQGNSFVGGGYRQQPPPRTSGMDDSASAFSTPNPVNLSPRINNNKQISSPRGSMSSPRGKFNSSSSVQSGSGRSTPGDRKFMC
jgi:hypothetical protein